MWKIEAKVDQMVIEDMKKEALQTISKFIKNEARFDVEYLENAMYYWVSNDYDAACTWYNDNWNSINVTQKQYVAAAFARQSAIQGDFETANACKAYIFNDAVNAKVDSVIENARQRQK